MIEKIQRDYTSKTLTISAATQLTEALDARNFAGLVVTIPATWTAASIGFKVSTTKGGTFLPLYNSSGGLVEITSPTANKVYTAPAELFGVHWVKLWSESGGVNINQAASRSLVVTLKG